MWFKFVFFLLSIFKLCYTVETTSEDKYEWYKIVRYLSVEQMQQKNSIVLGGINNTDCIDHLDIYMNNINDERWAMQMFDASTKIPESVLYGQVVHLGNFDECIEVQNVNVGPGPFDGQHCMVKFKPSERQNASCKVNKDDDTDTDILYDAVRMGTYLSAEATLTLSYCIPSTCSAKDLEDGINYLLCDNGIQVDATVDEAYCNTAKTKTLQTEDWVVVGVLICIVVLVAASTAYDLIIKGDSKKVILTTFSIASNGVKLLSTETSGDTLHCINGMRFITMCWIVWGHRYTVDIDVPSVNFITVRDFIKDVSRLYIVNGTLSVDTFFFLSGLLLSYVFLKQMKNKISGFNIPLFYLHRYIRLTPPYIVVILIEATLLRYIATGPLLAPITDLMAENCQKYWWTNILYVNNYVEAEHMCVGQSWYLSVDMQLYILSPLILYPLWKLPKKWNYILLSILTLAGIAAPFTISYVEKFSANLIYGNALRQMDQENYLYSATHSRFGPWVIGIAFGYIIYEAKRKEVKLTTIQIIIGWVLSNVALLGALNGATSFYQPGADKTVLESAFYNGFFRNVWAVGVGATVFMIVTGYGGAPGIILEWKIFPTLSRLCYCIYLTHAEYQVVQTMSLKTPIYIGDLEIWPAFFGDVIISIVLAVLLTLFVEMPVTSLERHLLGKDKRKQFNLDRNTISINAVET